MVSDFCQNLPLSPPSSSSSAITVPCQLVTPRLVAQVHPSPPRQLVYCPLSTLAQVAQYNTQCILQNVKHNLIHCSMLCVIHCSLIQFHMLTVMWRCNIWWWKVVPMTSRPVTARLVLKLYFGLKIPTVWTTQTPVDDDIFCC